MCRKPALGHSLVRAWALGKKSLRAPSTPHLRRSTPTCLSAAVAVRLPPLASNPPLSSAS